CIGATPRTPRKPCAGHIGKGKSRYLAAIRGYVRLYLGRTPGIRGEKRSRIFFEARRRDQIQARGSAADEGRDRQYAKTECADRDRFFRAVRIFNHEWTRIDTKYSKNHGLHGYHG